MGVWVEAARPMTLPASVVPVAVGTAAAAVTTEAGPVCRDVVGGTAACLEVLDLSVPRFLLALAVAVSLQVAVNYANDYFDGTRGVDTADRVGPRRAVAAGLVRPAAMLRATVAALAVAGVAGLLLAALAGWELVLVGAAAILAALGYSGGPRPYAAAGLGELFVFVFFGLVATAGSAYVQDEAVTVLGLLVAVPVGLLAVALLVVNNLRDVHTDAATGKRTLAVRLGSGRTRVLYVAAVAGAFLLLIPLVAVTGEGWLGLPLLSLPLLWPAIDLVRSAPIGPRLVDALEATGRGQLAYGSLLTAALLLVA